MSAEKELSKKILDNIGGINNIKILENCMTRVRLTLHNSDLVNLSNLKSIKGVLGVIINSDMCHVIVGPGIAINTKNEIAKLMQQQTSNIGDINKNKEAMKQKYELSASGVLKKIGNIFVPLIPAFIACGLIAGLNNILKNPQITGDFATSYPNLIATLGVFGASIFFVMMVFVGITTSQVFGGSVAIGAALAGVLTHPNLSQITIFNENLSPGRGGIISVILVVYLACLLENYLRKHIKGAFDLILIPMLVVLIMGTLALTILQPMAGYIADFIGNTASTAIHSGGFITGFILSGAFLPLVMTGIHQALIPIHAQLISDTGVTILFPILAMAGAGQVGASLAVFFKTKNTRLKKILKSALPVGFLGIGEPLIYGVTLPLGKPFLTACLGGAFGGAVIAYYKVGALSIGISGIPLMLSVAQGQMLFYTLGLLCAYTAGFLLTYLIGFEDPEN